jgi:hypothetical protein
LSRDNRKKPSGGILAWDLRVVMHDRAHPIMQVVHGSTRPGLARDSGTLKRGHPILHASGGQRIAGAPSTGPATV